MDTPSRGIGYSFDGETLTAIPVARECCNVFLFFVGLGCSLVSPVFVMLFSKHFDQILRYLTGYPAHSAPGLAACLIISFMALLTFVCLGPLMLLLASIRPNSNRFMGLAALVFLAVVGGLMVFWNTDAVLETVTGSKVDGSLLMFMLSNAIRILIGSAFFYGFVKLVATFSPEPVLPPRDSESYVQVAQEEEEEECLPPYDGARLPEYGALQEE